MRIYISGPMTGIENLNSIGFYSAEYRLHKAGHFVINPHALSAHFGTEEELSDSFDALHTFEEMNDTPNATDIDKTTPEYATAEYAATIARAVMDAELAAVRSCDAIYLLRGWENSRGAKKELAEAIAHGLTVMLEGAE